MINKPTVFMYSGQGSQYFGMGKELFETNPRFRYWMEYCDDIAFPFLPSSLIEQLYFSNKTRGELFDDIVFTNPALLCIEYCLTQLLLERDIHPDYLLGYSLGEFTAAVVSGAMSLDEGIQFSIAYAKLLQAKTPPAAMLAVIDSVSLLDNQPQIFQGCTLAGKNFNKNFVVTGLEKDIRFTQQLLSQRDVIHQRLPVNYGFHTTIIDPIEFEFKQLINDINLCSPKIKIISSLLAQPVNHFDADYLWRVTQQPVIFEKTIQTLLQQGDFNFIDVGPSGTLATFVKYILPGEHSSHHLEVMNQFGKNNQSLEKVFTFFN
ncbi:acyltransferase domain-containing protein [Aliikangiella maris]|uniref:Acyltransferase domain-containing protein n=2 Tax=Aliikangiella maris TaxID=3162458 RepID=A0ABV3MPL2_9GAMM